MAERIEDVQRRIEANPPVDMEEALAYIRKTGDSEGPAPTADRAEKLYHAIVPRLPEQFDFLVGRIALTVDEAAPALGMGVRTLRAAIARGEIPSCKVGSKRLIPLRALERHLEALAYTESGALDMWETMLAKAASVRLQRSRRDAFSARRELRRRMKEARDRAAALKSSPEATRAIAEKVIAELAAARSALSMEEMLTTKVGQDLLADITMLKDEFGLGDDGVE